jgi:hypothetical protein
MSLCTISTFNFGTVGTVELDQTYGRPTGLRIRSMASRAGSLRPGVGGSGQTDTRVASSHPSKT